MHPFPSKPAPIDHPIHDLLRDRWSPVHFDPTPLPQDQVNQLFEAARWAPSSFNEQPWVYLYAQKGDPLREKLESLLVEGNAWAKNAGLLIISFAKKTFTRNGKPNMHHMHDLGAATMQLVLQATAMGFISHQMEGFDHARANELMGMSDDYAQGSMIAIGYTGDPKKISPEHKKREEGPRVRKKVSEFARK